MPIATSRFCRSYILILKIFRHEFDSLVSILVIPSRRRCQCKVLGKYAEGKIGLSDKPALLNPPCKPAFVLFAFVPFKDTVGLLFSIIAGTDDEPGGFPVDTLFSELKRSIGVLVLEIWPLLLNVVKPTELSVTPTPIDRADVRVVWLMFGFWTIGFFNGSPVNVLDCVVLGAGVRVSYRLGNNLFVLGNVSGIEVGIMIGAGVVALCRGDWLSANLRFSQLITMKEMIDAS